MSLTPFLILFHIFVAAVYFLTAFFVVRKRGFHDLVTRLLVIYLLISILWEGIRASSAYLYNRLALPENVILHLPYYGLFLLGFVFMALTSVFLMNRFPYRRVWILALLWMGIALILDFNWIGLPDILWRDAENIIDLRSLIFAILVFGWGIYILGAGQVILSTYRKSERIAIKQRIAYWGLSFFLIFGSGILFLLLRDLFCSILNVLGTVTAFNIITVKRLPDLNKTTRRIVSTVLVGLLALLVYAAGFWAIQNYFPDLVINSPFLAGFSLALVLLVVFNPLLRLTHTWINKVIVGKAKDSKQLFREYSLSISNIVDLNQLSNVTIKLIGDALDVKNGILFSVDLEFGEDGVRQYRLKRYPVMEGGLPVSISIPLGSPVAAKLGDEHLPLLQSEIDFLPEFRYLTVQERSWMNSQEMEVYVPIHFKDEWVGVFAFGPKKSGASFFDDDIELLATLANQTSVALQNARLVESLVRINHEFRRAYTSMEEAHTKLARIDRTKLDFISIASHELRTPLTVLSGYSQMLMDDKNLCENTYYEKIISGIYDGTTRLHEIVDCMLDIAKIDTRAMELKAEPVNLNGIIQNIIQEYSKAISERDLSLETYHLEDLPTVQGDPEGLKKVFYHLIMNAVKFTPDGGNLAITGLNINKGDASFPHGGVEIVISDTGIGIDPRFKDLIFGKFYQTGELALHSTGKTKFKGGGPGLGLAIVRGIIQAHEGRVWADSPGYDEEKNPGSHFHVVIPLKSDTKLHPSGGFDV